MVAKGPATRHNGGMEFRALGAYLASLRGQRPPPVPGVDGLRELQAEAALKRSIRERRPVILAEEFPL